MTYEEANWDKISPVAREVHNRWRVAHGLLVIPPPKIDLYVPPTATKIRPIENDQEYIGAVREGLGPRMMGPGEEGFKVNGQKAKW